MKHFTQLFTALDQTTKTNKKVEALRHYFEVAPDPDKLWTIALLSHKRPRRSVNTTLLRQWTAEQSALPSWLFEESYHVVGDLAETIALVLPPPEKVTDQSLTHWINYIRNLGKLEEAQKKERVLDAWNGLGRMEKFVFNKLITGSFRVGVSQKLMVRALAKYCDVAEDRLAHRLMGNWSPDETTFEDLVLSKDPNEDASRPYPFFLAYALDMEPHELGEPNEWQAERKWDGIRGQVIKRNGELFVWSRGEELVTDKFPEYNVLEQLPEGTVIDGEILPWKDDRPLPFALLQTRIGRKNITRNVLQKAPVVLVAYDLLEYEGRDIREKPMSERRRLLEKIAGNFPSDSVLKLSPIVPFESWEALAKEREQSRSHMSEGIMLKKRDSPYRVGRKRGDWWKWKIDPLTVDAVMIYAMRGHGRRANLFTDYTFAVWNGDELVPFAKAYSGLTDAEIRKVDNWVKRNTIEKFGPVRSVKPEQVFEIAFEGIQKSSRHKSGIALRFPRISRWRLDKKPGEANTLDDLRQLLDVYESY